MALLPSKFLPEDMTTLGAAAAALEGVQRRGRTTVSELWSDVRLDPRVRSFDRFADGLALLYAVQLLDVKEGQLAHSGRAEAAL